MGVREDDEVEPRVGVRRVELQRAEVAFARVVVAGLLVGDEGVVVGGLGAGRVFAEGALEEGVRAGEVGRAEEDRAEEELRRDPAAERDGSLRVRARVEAAAAEGRRPGAGIDGVGVVRIALEGAGGFALPFVERARPEEGLGAEGDPARGAGAGVGGVEGVARLGVAARVDRVAREARGAGAGVGVDPDAGREDVERGLALLARVGEVRDRERGGDVARAGVERAPPHRLARAELAAREGDPGDARRDDERAEKEALAPRDVRARRVEDRPRDHRRDRRPHERRLDPHPARERPAITAAHRAEHRRGEERQRPQRRDARVPRRRPPHSPGRHRVRCDRDRDAKHRRVHARRLRRFDRRPPRRDRLRQEQHHAPRGLAQPCDPHRPALRAGRAIGARRASAGVCPNDAMRPTSLVPPGGSPVSSGGSLTRALLAEIAAEFPSFAILPKRTSRLQRAIHHLLAVITFGGQRVYLTRYHTVLFGKLWVPDAWDAMSDEARYVLLRHERIHLRQRARMGDVAMAFVYLVPIFPLGLALGRARIEWEAYVETIRATYELHGHAAAEGLRHEIVRRFTSGDYGWMWPFPRTVNRWFDEALEASRPEP